MNWQKGNCKFAIVVLAGGRAARMGGNKVFADFTGAPLISHVLSRLHSQSKTIWVNVVDDRMAENPLLSPFKALIDAAEFANLGPLSGVMTGLLEAHRVGLDGIVTAPCDMPRIPLTMAQTLVGAAEKWPDRLIYFKGKRDYPLCSFWPSSVLPRLNDSLVAGRGNGGLAVMRFIDTIPNHAIFTEDDDAFANINVL